jgi:hypothetical protein
MPMTTRWLLYSTPQVSRPLSLLFLDVWLCMFNQEKGMEAHNTSSATLLTDHRYLQISNHQNVCLSIVNEDGAWMPDMQGSLTWDRSRSI